MDTVPDAGWRLAATYATLPDPLHEAVRPATYPGATAVTVNAPLALDLGLDPDRLAGATGAAWFAGGTLPPGARPLAMAYAGHQFGHFTMLGDGRALLLGEQVAPDGRRWDIHLKGSGRTRFARGGDGRAALGPMLREHLMGEAMHGLGIPTTRALAVLATGEPVQREEPLPGALLVRVAASHLRVGTVQYAAATGRRDLLEALVAYVDARHPHAVGERPVDRLIDGVLERQAALVAAWMAAGFVHGVMNTDNVALSGETIDYGPCAFLDGHDPSRTFSSIDRHGRYAYGQQPAVTQWNLARLVEAVLPLLDDDADRALAAGNAHLGTFPARYAAHRLAILRRRLGLVDADDGDGSLADAFLAGLATAEIDHHMAWLDLLRLDRDQEPRVLVGSRWSEWIARWRTRRLRDPALVENARVILAASVPRVIPRNHRVEEALAGAVRGHWEPWRRLLAAVGRPFVDDPGHAGLMEPPSPRESACHRTFCGT